MNILLLILITIAIVIVLGQSKETLINTSCSSVRRNVGAPKISHENCTDYANKACELESYFVRNTKTHKFPISVLPGKPPKTISTECWQNKYNCCKHNK